MELTDSVKELRIETAKSLKGSARRLFMARTVKELGPGGQRRAFRGRFFQNRPESGAFHCDGANCPPSGRGSEP